MKKILCLTAILAMTAITGFAADKTKAEPDVIVDGSKVLFEDQNAVIVDGVTLVPARGVFEAMGNTVKWVEESRMVRITTSTGVRYVRLYIDSDTMKVNQYKTLMEEITEEIKLEVPAQIINDRTMIPLRAVSEAFDCEVDWNEEDYVINITTTDPPLLEGYEHKPKTPIEEMVTMSLSTDAKDVKAGDEFDVYVEVKNIPENMFVTNMTTTFEFDKSQFEYIEEAGTAIGNDDMPFEADAVGENADYELGAVAIFISIEEEPSRSTDGKIFKGRFKKLTDESATIALNYDFRPEFGYETFITLRKTAESDLTIADKIYDGKNLNLNKTPLIIE